MYKGEPPLEYYRRDYLNPDPGPIELLLSSFAEETRNGENAAADINATEWMSPVHTLAFLPYNQGTGLFSLRSRTKKKGYVFGKGRKFFIRTPETSDRSFF